MAWNGSDQGKAVGAGVPPARNRKGNGNRVGTGLRSRGDARPFRGLLAGAIVVALGGAGVWWFVGRGGGQGADRPTDIGKRGAIAEAKPQIPKKQEPRPEALPKPRAEDIPYWKRASSNGLDEVQQHKWWAYHQPPAAYTNDSSLKESPPVYHISSNHIDNQIACYLWIRPGQTIIGMPNYGEEETRLFYESLKHPLQPAEGDSDDICELKQAVEETKLAIKERLDAGETLDDVLNGARREFQRLDLYRRDIESQIHDFSIKEDVTDEDVEDFIKAANMMLEDKGIAPIEFGPVSKEMLKHKKGI